MSNDYNYRSRGRVGWRAATSAPPVSPTRPCRIPQRVNSTSRTTKPNRTLHNQTSRRISERSELSGGKARPDPKLMVTFRKSQSKLSKKSTTMSEHSDILDQETIRVLEELELQKTDSTTEDLETTCDMQILKMNWEDKILRFEKLKNELGQRQRNIMQAYINLKSNYKVMVSLGHKVDLPPVDELYIMNVAKMEPDQLLQLCTIDKSPEEASSWSSKVNALNVDVNKLSDFPEKLMTVSELILNKRKQIIDWFDAIKTEEKGIAMSKLTKKINEFNAENEMLNSSLQTCKAKFLEDVQCLVENLRSGMTEVLSMQLRTEDLMYKLTQLSAENTDLKKQLQTNKNLKLQTNKAKIEELQRELKDEKSKRAMLKDRLMRADGQTKIAQEHAAQLDAALELARTQNWTLERTVKQLSEQNQKLQTDFEIELSKLTESIQENTTHLEEIADARENLRIEKECLQKRLDAITENNNKVFQNLQQELDSNVSNLTKAEQQLKEANEAKTNLEAKVESLSKELLETEQSRKDLLCQVQEKDEQISKLTATDVELKNTKKELENAYSEITQLRVTMQNQSKTIEEIEQNFREMSNIEKTLQTDLNHKENYIVELENKVTHLGKEIYESHHKLQDYEHKLKVLKTDTEKMQHDLGEYKNIGELRELIKQQQNKIFEMSRRNSELSESLQEKELDLERHIEHLAQQDNVIEQKKATIKKLLEKDEEQANVIKLLQNNLEIRAQADSDFSQQLAEKNTEVSSLVNNLDSRKQQISQLEKIILALEDQLRKILVQRTKDQEKIAILEKVLSENGQIKANHRVDVPSEDLDNLIKILEWELGAPEPTQRSEKPLIDRKRFGKTECTADDARLKAKYKQSANMQDKIERKKATLHMETPKLPVRLEPVYKKSDDKIIGNATPLNNDMSVMQILSNQRVDKKRKMFKFAGHKF